MLTQSVPSYPEHHFAELYAAGHPVVLCTVGDRGRGHHVPDRGGREGRGNGAQVDRWDAPRRYRCVAAGLGADGPGRCNGAGARTGLVPEFARTSTKHECTHMLPGCMQDDSGVFGTTLSREYAIAAAAFKLPGEVVWKRIRNSQGEQGSTLRTCVFRAE